MTKVTSRAQMGPDPAVLVQALEWQDRTGPALTGTIHVAEQHEATLRPRRMPTRSLEGLCRERAARSWAAAGSEIQTTGEEVDLGSGPRQGLILQFRLRASNLVLRP